MVKWMKLLCIITYGVMLANVGIKIYDKYKEKTAPKKVEFVNGKSQDNTYCKMYLMGYENKSATLQVVIANYEAFVHRQLHNKSSETECFMLTSTDIYKLVKYERTDVSSNEIQATVTFEKRPYKKTRCTCYRHEYYFTFTLLDSGIVNHRVTEGCPMWHKPKPAKRTPQLKWNEYSCFDFSSLLAAGRSIRIIAAFFGAIFIIIAALFCSDWMPNLLDKILKTEERNTENSEDDQFKEPVTASEEATTKTTPEQNETDQPESESSTTETCVDTEDDNRSNTPEDIAVFTVPEHVEIQSEAESDLEESTNQSSIEADNSNIDQLTPVDMDMSSEEASFEYIN